MRVDDTNAMNIRQSNSLGPIGSSDLRKGGVKASGDAPTTDQAAANAHGGLLALALHVSDPTSSPRVEELRNAIQGGTYQADMRDVSRAMIDAALNLG